MNNSWQEVHFGSKSPVVVNAIVEIPKGSRGKFELDKETGHKAVPPFERPSCRGRKYFIMRHKGVSDDSLPRILSRYP